MHLFYAMGGTLHPRLNMQTISNTPTAVSVSFTTGQFVEMLVWLTVETVVITACWWGEGVRRWLPVLHLLVSVSRGGWYQVTVSLLPPHQPSPVSWIIWRSRARRATRAAGDRRECPLICCLMWPVNSSCCTCSDARNISRYNSSRYDSIRYTQYRFRCDTDPVIVHSLFLTPSPPPAVYIRRLQIYPHAT